MAMGQLSGIKAGPPPDQATAIKILKSALDSGFDPTKSAALRNAEIGEHDTHIANLIGLHDPQSQSELQRQIYLKQSLQADNQADPYTGLEAQSHTRDVGDAMRTSDIYNRSDVTGQREDTERLKRLLTGEPNRIAGNTARDVAEITGESNIRRQQIASQGVVDAADAKLGGAGEHLSPTERTQQARGQSAQVMLDKLKELYDKLPEEGGYGPAQMMRGSMQKLKGVFGLQDPATEYQNMRKAAAVGLAVAIQGARPSDTDAKAFADMFPDLTIPKHVGKSQFDTIQKQIDNLVQHKQQQPAAAAPLPTGGKNVITNPNWGAR